MVAKKNRQSKFSREVLVFIILLFFGASICTFSNAQIMLLSEPATSSGSTPTPSGSCTTHVADIPTNGAHDWEFFTSGGKDYLLVANNYNGSSTNIDSKIYTWDATTDTATEVARIATNGAFDWEFFTSGGKDYVVVANQYNGSTRNIDSKIYTWDAATDTATEVARIATNRAFDWEFFTSGGKDYLVVANHYNESSRSYNIDSKIYSWDAATDTATEVARIPTNGAYDWEFFTSGGKDYLAVANGFSDGSSHSTDSKIYTWDATTDTATEVAGIRTYSANDWEFFTSGGKDYLAVASNFYGHQSVTETLIYAWDAATDTATEVARIATNGDALRDWEFFTSGGKDYLVVANAYNGSSRNIDSKIYSWDAATDTATEEVLIPTVGADDWEFFTSGGKDYLVVANQENGLSYNIDSKVYQINLSSTCVP